MSSDQRERNKAVIRRFYDELVSARRIELLEELVAEDAVDGAVVAQGGGREDFRRHLTWLWSSVEDVKATVTDLLAEDDRVVAFWRIEGVQRGALFGVEPTGRPFSGVSISWITLRDGKIVRYDVLPDRLGIAERLRGVAA